MSRRRSAWPHRSYVELQLRCVACGADVGSAYQFRDQHPRAGESVVDARVGRLVDRPQGGSKLVARCSRCGAVPQKVWDGIVSQLDQLDETRNWRGATDI